MGLARGWIYLLPLGDKDGEALIDQIVKVAASGQVEL